MKVQSNDFLKDVVKYYNNEEVALIKKSLVFANERHSGQTRKSGAPYIVHPLTVAHILLEAKADANTICAALLHDVLEDTNTPKEEIACKFNEDIAHLVEGVTNIKNSAHSSIEEERAGYLRKLTTSIFEDVRIIIIKLIDRLHNMQTLDYQSVENQQKVAKETLEVYVPIAHYLGIYKIRFLLEDLSFKYLERKAYNECKHLKEEIASDSRCLLDEMVASFKEKLTTYNIKVKIETDIKNIYGIYKQTINNEKNDKSDLLKIRIIVNNLAECYQVLGVVHSLSKPVDSKFKDYISNPKTNRYQAIHTTVYTTDDKLVQVQILTKEMHKVNTFGIMTAWNDEEKRNNIQRYLMMNFPFVKVLREINSFYPNNLDFMKKLQHDVLKEKIYVIIGNGNIMELPSDTTLDDLCKKLDVSYERLLINNEIKPIDYVLENNDVISAINVKVKKK